MRPTALSCLPLGALCGCFTKQPVLYPNPQLEARFVERGYEVADWR